MLISNSNHLKTKNYCAQQEQEALAPIWKKLAYSQPFLSKNPIFSLWQIEGWRKYPLLVFQKRIKWVCCICYTCMKESFNNKCFYFYKYLYAVEGKKENTISFEGDLKLNCAIKMAWFLRGSPFPYTDDKGDDKKNIHRWFLRVFGKRKKK